MPENVDNRTRVNGMWGGISEWEMRADRGEDGKSRQTYTRQERFLPMVISERVNVSEIF